MSQLALKPELAGRAGGEVAYGDKNKAACGSQITSKEERARGKVDGRVYIQYMRAMGGLGMLLWLVVVRSPFVPPLVPRGMPCSPHTSLGATWHALSLIHI